MCSSGVPEGIPPASVDLDPKPWLRFCHQVQAQFRHGHVGARSDLVSWSADGWMNGSLSIASSSGRSGSWKWVEIWRRLSAASPGQEHQSGDGVPSSRPLVAHSDNSFGCDQPASVFIYETPVGLHPDHRIGRHDSTNCILCPAPAGSFIYAVSTLYSIYSTGWVRIGLTNGNSRIQSGFQQREARPGCISLRVQYRLIIPNW